MPDHARGRHLLRASLRASRGGDLGHYGRGHEQRADRADARLHPATLPHRRDRDDAGAQPRTLSRPRARSGAHDLGRSSSISILGNVLAPGIHLRLEPDLRRRSCWRRACRSSDSGVEPPTPDWGLMLSTLRQAIYVQPYVCALPGVLRSSSHRCRSTWSATGCARRWTCGYDAGGESWAWQRHVRHRRRARPKLDAVPPGDPRDRGGKVQPMLTVTGLKKHFPILVAACSTGASAACARSR